MFAFYNPNSKNINFIESNQNGVITTNHGVPIVKTNNVIVYNTCYAVNDCKSIRISSNYENLDVIKIQIIVEEITGTVIKS